MWDVQVCELRSLSGARRGAVAIRLHVMLREGRLPRLPSNIIALRQYLL